MTMRFPGVTDPRSTGPTTHRRVLTVGVVGPQDRPVLGAPHDGREHHQPAKDAQQGQLDEQSTRSAPGRQLRPGPAGQRRAWPARHPIGSGQRPPHVSLEQLRLGNPILPPLGVIGQTRRQRRHRPGRRRIGPVGRPVAQPLGERLTEFGQLGELVGSTRGGERNRPD